MLLQRLLSVKKLNAFLLLFDLTIPSMFAAKWLAVDSSFVLNAKFSSVTFACFT
jgi:hypothetical protein